MLERRRQQHAGHVRPLGKAAGHLRHEALRGVGGRQRRPLRRRGGRTVPRDSLEVIHVEAVGLVGRHAPGGGVRVGQVAHLLQVRHDVANGGWRKPADVASGDGA